MPGDDDRAREMMRAVIEVMNVVRRSDQVRALTAAGVEIALDSSFDDFDS